jgi:hypothetical protein
MVAVLAAIAIGDAPRLYGAYRVQTVVLDAAYTDERQLVERLEAMLGARVHRVKVRRVDLVEATTTVEARFQLLPAPATAPAGAAGGDAAGATGPRSLPEILPGGVR